MESLFLRILFCPCLLAVTHASCNTGLNPPGAELVLYLLPAAEALDGTGEEGEVELAGDPAGLLGRPAAAGTLQCCPHLQRGLASRG